MFKNIAANAYICSTCFCVTKDAETFESHQTITARTQNPPKSQFRPAVREVNSHNRSTFTIRLTDAITGRASLRCSIALFRLVRKNTHTDTHTRARSLKSKVTQKVSNGRETRCPDRSNSRNTPKHTLDEPRIV